MIYQRMAEYSEQQTLESLKAGVNTASYFSTNIPETPPMDCDVDKLKRGQLFFQKNIYSCIFAMLSSLVCGLSVTNLLQPLVYTDQSGTTETSLRRYIDTVVHVINWHISDLWKQNSPACRSLNQVRQMHNKVAEKMTRDLNEKKTYFSQYDMSLVQCGFVGAIVLHPDQFAICSDELDDYIYLWRFIGKYLGISDQNNICFHGYRQTFSICKEIEDNVLLPALRNPPKDFSFMAKAFTDGLNRLTFVRLYSPEAVVNFVYDATKQKRQRQSIMDELRIMFFKFSMTLMVYMPGFQSASNKLIMHLYSMFVKHQGKKL